MQTQEKNRLSAASLPIVARDIRAELAEPRPPPRAASSGPSPSISPAIRRCAEDARLLRAIPGIGPVAATEILAHLPEAGRVDRREVASLAGLAPRARESGKYKGRRSLGDGRRHLRRALYMAALSALRHDGFLSGFVARMKADRKPSKVILMAVARRLLVIANAILRSRTPFQPPASNPDMAASLSTVAPGGRFSAARGRAAALFASGCRVRDCSAGGPRDSVV